ncbi:MAG: hypothetical protein ACO1RX_09420 [Candidatus Sericytochromatia bacterium]
MPAPRPPGQPPRRPALPNSRPAPRSRYSHLVFDADRFFAEKDYLQAGRIYQEALKEAPPGETHALIQLCRCTRKQARKAQKREDFVQVRQLLENMLNWERVTPHLKALDYFALAEACLELGDLVASREALDLCLGLQPELLEAQRLGRRLQSEELARQLGQL